MGIKIVILEGRSCPMVICDCCGVPINGGIDGVYLYNSPMDAEHADVFFAHKGKCHKTLEKANNAYSFIELPALPIFLLTNMQEPPNTAKAIAKGIMSTTPTGDDPEEFTKEVLREASIEVGNMF